MNTTSFEFSVFGDSGPFFDELSKDRVPFVETDELNWKSEYQYFSVVPVYYENRFQNTLEDAAEKTNVGLKVKGFYQDPGTGESSTWEWKVNLDPIPVDNDNFYVYRLRPGEKPVLFSFMKQKDAERKWDEEIAHEDPHNIDLLREGKFGGYCFLCVDHKPIENVPWNSSCKIVHLTNEEEDLSPWDDPSLEPENYARDRMVWDHYADDWVIEPPWDEQEH